MRIPRYEKRLDFLLFSAPMNAGRLILLRKSAVCVEITALFEARSVGRHPTYASGRPRLLGKMPTHGLGDVTRLTAFARVSM